MGTTRFWLLLVAAQIVVLVALAAAGSVTAATPALRYTGFACLAGIFACVPPIVIKLFVAGQVKIGNGARPMVRSIQQHEAGLIIGVWAMIVVALVMALPRIRSDLQADREANAAALQANAPTAATSTESPASATDTVRVATPGAGSPTRTAILDAVRKRLKMSGRFKVDHIRTAGRFAFVRATEVVELDKGELQETDLTVAALLELPTASTIASWRIVELWTLHDEQEHPFAEFIKNVRAKLQREQLPVSLLPGDM